MPRAPAKLPFGPAALAALLAAVGLAVGPECGPAIRSAAAAGALRSDARAAAVVPSDSRPAAASRPRARDIGLRIGVFDPGPLDAITDVEGVRVGHVTLIEGDDVRTGVTAVLPHPGNLFRDKVAAGIHVFNAFGKLVGSTQVDELGRIETPIVLTNTLSVWDAAAAVADHVLGLPGNEEVRSINPVVGETNDGQLNDIRGRHVKAEHVRQAIAGARGGPVEEGSVGAGTGTVAFGWKGGIGTSSRRVPVQEQGSPGRGSALTIGVLVQTNFGGRLTIDGVPVWRHLQPAGAPGPAAAPAAPAPGSGGSCMIVVATDAPLDARQLQRLAARAMHGMARAGSDGGHGSGDYVIAFSTANRTGADPRPASTVGDVELSLLFSAVIEATEEAIDNSLLRATTVRGRAGRVAEAIPIEPLRRLLSREAAGAP